MGDHLVACSMVSGVACRIFLRGLVRLSFAVRSLCRCHEGTDGAVDAWCEITLGSSSAYGRGKAGMVNEDARITLTFYITALVGSHYPVFVAWAILILLESLNFITRGKLGKQ